MEPLFYLMPREIDEALWGKFVPSHLWNIEKTYSIINKIAADTLAQRKGLESMLEGLYVMDNEERKVTALSEGWYNPIETEL